jgi:hypothetical protein
MAYRIVSPSYCTVLSVKGKVVAVLNYMLRHEGVWGMEV